MPRPEPSLDVRRARDEDAQDLFGLIALCFAGYRGCLVDPCDDLPDLLSPASGFAGPGEAFWVVEDGRGRVCACIAVDAPELGLAELHRLYVRPDQRRRGLGGRLVALAETLAAEHGAHRVLLWSDTRFTDAHRLYRRLGYRPGSTRLLGDASHSVEQRFDKALTAPAR